MDIALLAITQVYLHAVICLEKMESYGLPFIRLAITEK